MTETLSMKETIIRAMQDLPEEDTLLEAMERLEFIRAIEKGIKSADEGRTYTQEEVEAMFKTW